MISSSASKLRASYNARYAVQVAPRPPTITVGANGAPSSINGRSLAAGGLTPNGAVPDGYSGPCGTVPKWVFANTVNHALTYAQGGSKRFAYDGRRFDFKLGTSSGGATSVQWRVRYSEDGGRTFMWASPGMNSVPLNSGAFYVLVDFGSAAARIIELIAGEGMAIYGFNFETAHTFGAAPNDAPRLAMYGDSYAFGQGATNFTTAMVRRIGEAVGVLDVVNHGYRQNAWARIGGSQGTQPYLPDRLSGNGVLDEISEWGPLDAVFLAGSINDNTSDPALLLTKATQVFQRTRAGQPGALIVFTLQLHGPDSRMPAANADALRQAFRAVLGSDPGATMLDSITENWVPVGKVGSSPYFPASGDTAHPNQAGHDFFAGRIAAGMMVLVDRVLA